MKLGVIVRLAEGPETCIGRAAELGFPSCQVAVTADLPLEPDTAARLRAAAEARGVEISSLWVHCRGGQVWDFVDGPRTIGLVPEETRRAGVERLKQGSDFARLVGVGSVTTHAGFIPENPGDPVFGAVVEALREVAVHCRANGQALCLETGQETPVTVLRTIEAVGTGNVGVNLDPANLLMYGKANPLDALDVIGRYVRGVHAKDGEYPTDGLKLGVEKPLGEGRVGFPALIARLKELGYDRPITIEREVHGAAQLAGIEQARRLLEPLL
jgi:L-ribulose-5-phosphate 3-epimerase